MKNGKIVSSKIVDTNGNCHGALAGFLAEQNVYALICGGIGGGVTAFFSSRLSLKPVNELINKMNRLAAGDFKTRLKFEGSVSAHPAVMEITESFNTMAEELENTEMLRNDLRYRRC